MRIIIYSTIISIFMAVNIVCAQDTPIQVKNPPVMTEAVFNGRGISFLTLTQKRLASAQKFGVFAITDILGKWSGKETDEYMVQGNVTYKFAKGFNVMSGFHMASGVGVRPAFGVMYSYAKPELVVVVNPRYYIDDKGNLEAFVLSEYKPKISENWRFYSRIQGIYSFTADGGNHSRSYARLRAGLGHREFSFGLAGNFEFYGPQKLNENSLGIFILTTLF
jgi:hypothetical protein